MRWLQRIENSGHPVSVGGSSDPLRTENLFALNGRKTKEVIVLWVHVECARRVCIPSRLVISVLQSVPSVRCVVHGAFSQTRNVQCQSPGNPSEFALSSRNTPSESHSLIGCVLIIIASHVKIERLQRLSFCVARQRSARCGQTFHNSCSADLCVVMYRDILGVANKWKSTQTNKVQEFPLETRRQLCCTATPNQQSSQ